MRCGEFYDQYANDPYGFRGGGGVGWEGLEPSTNALKGRWCREKSLESANKVPVKCRLCQLEPRHEDPKNQIRRN